MSFRVDVEVPIDALKGFNVNVTKAIEDWMGGVLDEIRKESTSHSRKISYARMPKGGSYVGRIKWRPIRRGPKDYVGELYNDHEWAQAVEFGTKRHPITSNKVMTAQPTLAQKGGKGRRWGMKYGTTIIKGRVFDHPGSRAFHIFRDTARHIDSISKRIVERVFWRIV